MLRPYSIYKTYIDNLIREIKINNVVVVAHYNKDISWINKIDNFIDVEVYSSNKDVDVNIYKNLIYNVETLAHL
jgi:hypothetical protein